MHDYLISLNIFPSVKSRENRWNSFLLQTLILFSLLAKGGVLEERKVLSGSCVPAVSPVCLGQNDVTAGGLLGGRGVGLLRENENAPTRRGQVDKAGRQTFDGPAAAGVTRRKTSKRIDRPFLPPPLRFLRVSKTCQTF